MTATVLKFVARGVIGATVADAEEEWSCGMNFSYDSQVGTLPTQAQLDSLTSAFEAGWENFIKAAGPRFQSNVWLTEARGYVYDGLPRTPAIMVSEVVDLTPSNGTQAPVFPNQVSLCVTFEAAGRVKPKYGRMYLPPQNLAVLATGHINAGSGGLTLDAVNILQSGFRGTLNATLNVPGGWHLVIPTTVAGRTPKAVANLRAGTVLDTQRRRRNKENESYVDEAITTNP